MSQPNAVHQYNLGTTNTNFKMFGIQTNFVFLQQECFMQIMYLQLKLTVYWTWRSTEFPCSTLKFQYSQCGVMLMFCFFELYYINIITLIIRVIRLRLSNQICGSNLSKKKCMQLKNNWFPALSRHKTYLWIRYIDMFWLVLTETVPWTYIIGKKRLRKKTESTRLRLSLWVCYYHCGQGWQKTGQYELTGPVVNTGFNRSILVLTGRFVDWKIDGQIRSL